MNSQCEGCLNVGLGFDIVLGHLFPPQYIKVCQLKLSQCMGPCSKPQSISAVLLPTLSICRGFLCGYIGTGVVSSP